MLGSSSTTSSLASGRCRASVCISMLYILAPHAEDNLKVRWIRSPSRAHAPTAEMPRQAGPLPVRGSGGLAPVGDGGGPRAHAQLGVDPSDVVLHGFLGQEQMSGDFPVGLPVRDERHDLHLACGQPVRLPGAIENGSLASVWPRDLVIVHLTSDCGRGPDGVLTAANVPNTVGTTSIHEGSCKWAHEPIWTDLVSTCTQPSRPAYTRPGES